MILAKHARLVVLGLSGLVVACGGESANSPKVQSADPNAPSEASLKGSGDPRCDSTVKGREFSEYDTSGDEVPDVRKVFMRVGDANTSRLVMICREADVNHDNVKDIVRIYDDEGRPLHEHADRNFDRKFDQTTSYQSGEIVEQSFDNDFDGRIDTKVFFNRGAPMRAERDIAGRSTPEQWRPDRWEYFEGGKLVRIGTDTDGDTRVDHWDRDAAWRRAQEQAQAQSAAAAQD